MTPSAVCRIFQEPGHEHLVADRILALLDWRSILSIGQTCTYLNKLVTTRSSLQLPLRIAYYGFPPSYADFDHPISGPTSSAAARLDRLIDIQKGYMRLKPKRIQFLQLSPPLTTWVATCGLVVAGINEKGPEPGSSENKTCAMLASGWQVYDTFQLRDTGNKPQPAFTVLCDTPFQLFDACREDNLVATSKVDRLDNDLFRVTIRFFLLEPRIGTWEESVDAIPHPLANRDTITFYEVCRESQFDESIRELYWDRMCPLQIGPDGSLTAFLGDLHSTRLFNWRTGEELACFYPRTDGFSSLRSVPLGDDSLLVTGYDGGVHHDTVGTCDDHRNVSLGIVTGDTSDHSDPDPWFYLSTGSVAGRLRLPDWYSYGLSDDRSLGIDYHNHLLAINSCVTHYKPNGEPRCLVNTSTVLKIADIKKSAQAQRKANLSHLIFPLRQMKTEVDFSVAAGVVTTIISGYRALAVVKKQSQDQHYRYKIHLTHYSFKAGDDPVHTAPLGGLPPQNPPVPPLTSTPQQVEAGISEPWDATRTPGEWGSEMLPELLVHEPGWLRTSAALTHEVLGGTRYDRYVQGDASNVYVSFASGLEWCFC